jgi:hypothetical protein
MSPERFQARLQSVFEDRGLVLRRAIHPSDESAIKKDQPLRYGEKRFTWQVWRKSKTGKYQRVWNITHPDGRPKGLYEEEIAWMARCDNYRYWKNNPDRPTTHDLNRMDRDLFNMEGEEIEKEKRREAWRKYRREECMPRLRHDLVRRSGMVRHGSKTQHSMR